MPKPYTPNDKLAQRAHRAGYRARSVYKLQELDQRYQLLHPGFRVLDLASAPGSWLQWIVKQVGVNGQVVGVDLQPIEQIEGAQLFIGDVTDQTLMDQIVEQTSLAPIDLITSDVAPNTSGIPGRDHLLSVELNRAILGVALRYLRGGGNLVLKVFDGPELTNLKSELEANFRKVIITKVQASRDRSSELYIICLNKKS